jgi:putative membrane protein
MPPIPVDGVACQDDVMTFLWRVIINAIAIWLAAALLSGVSIVDKGSSTDNNTANTILTVLVIGAVLAVVNSFVKPLVKLLTLPVYLLTLGLFGLVVNALMLLLTGWISKQTDWGLQIDGFWWAVAGALFVSVAGMILQAILPGKSSRRR